MTESHIPLDKHQILNVLIAEGYLNSVDLHVLSEVDSTNTYLKSYPASNQPVLCIAETQTAGRGRFARAWHSPFGENIYFSLRWQAPCALSQLAALSLVVSITIIQAIKILIPDVNLQIKWPNDVLWEGQKISGNLIELTQRHPYSTEVIIGIGLNVNADPAHDSPIPTPWTSLYAITGHRYDRNRLIAMLIVQLDAALKSLSTEGLSVFMTDWKNLDWLYGKSITMTQHTANYQGIAHGINAEGQLILIDTAGVYHYLSAGDATLHSPR